MDRERKKSTIHLRYCPLYTNTFMLKILRTRSGKDLTYKVKIFLVS